MGKELSGSSPRSGAVLLCYPAPCHWCPPAWVTHLKGGQVVLAHPNLLQCCSGGYDLVHQGTSLVYGSTVWCRDQHQVSHPRPDWCSPWTDATMVGPNHRPASPMTHLFSAGQMLQLLLNNYFRSKFGTNFSGISTHRSSQAHMCVATVIFVERGNSGVG